MGNAESDSEIALAADGSCTHIVQAVSILLRDRVVSSRTMINKSQCICYYCSPLNRHVFTRGKRKDVLPNEAVKIALNFSLIDEKKSAQEVVNSYRRLYYSTDPVTLSHVLTSKRFYPKGTKFIRGDLAVADESAKKTPFERLNYFTAQLELYNPNQVLLTPEPELGFKWSSHPDGHKIALQLLFDPDFVFQKGQDTMLPGSEALVRRGSVAKDLRMAESFALDFRNKTTYYGFPDSESEYYFNSDQLFQQQQLCPSFYFYAIFVRLA